MEDEQVDAERSLVGACHGRQRLSGILLSRQPRFVSKVVVALLPDLLWRPFHHRFDPAADSKS